MCLVILTVKIFEIWILRGEMGCFFVCEEYNDKLMDYIMAIAISRGSIGLTEKELRKLNRYQLLEMLITQMERADKLQEKLDTAVGQLNNKEIRLNGLGSIAEASLQLSGVFEAAQAAADRYLEAARKRAEEIEEEAHEKAAQILLQAQEQALRIKGDR